MNKIINQYLIFNYLKIVLNTALVFFSLGVILNLFEEIEFFKNLEESSSLPFILTLSFVPTLVQDLLPFVIFIASMFYFIYLKSSKDLLSIKIFGYSNLKITFLFAAFAFSIGVLVLIAVNPITSTLVKYYETEKARYAKDVDHLVSVNKNGVWIKEVDELGYKIINAEKLEDKILKQISIYIFDKNEKISKRIEANSAIISENPWQMKDVYVYNFKTNQKERFEYYEFETDKIFDRINSLYKNLNTLSFIHLIRNYDQLIETGYSKKSIDEQMHKFISLPFFLSLMVVLAAIFTIGRVDTKQNYYYIILSILTSVIIFYFKDLSIALGQTEKISQIMSVWMPIIVISLFCLIGVVQINEK